MTRDEVLANVWAYLGVAGGAMLALAVLFAALPSVRRRLLPVPRLRPVRWSGHEVVVAALLYAGLQSFLPVVLLDIGFFDSLIGMRPPDNDPNALTTYLIRCVVIASPLFTFLFLAMLSTLLYLRCGLRPHHYGLTLVRWPAQVAVGIAAFLLMTPVVLGVFTLAALVLGNQPHAMDRLHPDGTEPWEWGFVFFQATIAAPLVEEILFRGVLLGWLRRASLVGHTVVMGLVGLFAYESAAGLAKPRSNEWWQNPDPLVFGGLLIAGYGSLLYFMLKRHAKALDQVTMEYVRLDPDIIEPEEADWRKWNAWIAVYGSAALFATTHAGAWPTPIPLFLLGMGLGWLATRTQSLVAPITVHLLFNLVAFIVLMMTR